MSTDADLDASVKRVLLGILAEGEPYTGIPLVDPETNLLAPPIVDAIRGPLEEALTELDADVTQLQPDVAELKTLVEDGRLSEPNLAGTFVPLTRRHTYDVRDYIGVDDIGAAINRAITAASTDAQSFGGIGGQVLLPPGSHEQTTEIVPKSGVDVIGWGSGKTILVPQGGVTAFKRIGTAGTPLRDVLFEGFVVDGSEQAGPTEAPLLKAFFLTYLHRVTMRGIYAHDTGHTAFGSDFLADCVFEDLIATGAGRIGGTGGAGCSGIGVGVSGSWATAIGEHDYSLNVINCVARRNANYGMFFETQTDSDRQKDIKVTNFSASENGLSGLADSGADGLIVQGAVLTDNGHHGFAVDAGTFPFAPTPGINGRLSNIIARNNAMSGVMLDTSADIGITGYSITDSYIRENTQHGVHIKLGTADQYRPRIRNSEIILNGRHGIFYEAANATPVLFDLVIDGCDLMNNGTSGAGYHGFRASGKLGRPRITNTTATDIRSSGKTQEYGFSFGDAVYGGIISQCSVNGNATNATIGISGGTQLDANTIVSDVAGFTHRAGTPEGAISAPRGTRYSRTDGGAATTLYVKESAAGGSTGWVAK